MTYRFDPVDVEQLKLLAHLSPGRRWQCLLDARELAVGLIRGRLRRRYPELPVIELNLKVLEEIECVQRLTNWLAVIGWVIFLTSCDASPPATPPQYNETVQVADLEIVTGQTIYVPVYPEITFGVGKTLDLAVTLSVHNTDLAHSIVLVSARYYNAQGQLIREYLSQPVQLGPLAATDFFVEQYDESAGLGANFIVEWVAEQPVYEPVVEAVMIGTVASQGISFISPGRVITQTSSIAVTD
jgi:hypothetical protein